MYFLKSTKFRKNKELALSALIGLLLSILAQGNLAAIQGNSWGATEVVSTESTGGSYRANMAIDSHDNLHIVWHDHSNYAGSGGDGDIFYKHWNAATANWATTEVISTDSAWLSYTPKIAIDSHDNLHVVWYDYTDYDSSGIDWDIFYKHWNATTGVWTTTGVVSTQSTGDSYYPNIAIDSHDNLHVVWNDWTNYVGSGTDVDIFYKHWNATIAIWNATEVVSTESPGDSWLPNIAIDSQDNLHVVWHAHTDYDSSGGDADILYKYATTATSSNPNMVIDTQATLYIAWYDIIIVVVIVTTIIVSIFVFRLLNKRNKNMSYIKSQ